MGRLTRMLAVLGVVCAITSIDASSVSSASVREAKERWEDTLKRQPHLKESLRRIEPELKPFLDEHDEETDGPLDESSMANEFGAMRPAQWRLFLESRGIALEPPTKPSPAPTLALRSTGGDGRVGDKLWRDREMDANGKGASLMREQCADWQQLFREHVALHNRIVDPRSDLPAAQRRVLVFGSIPHGLGNRLGAYVSYFLLCMVAKRACLLDDSRVVAPMGELFEPMGGEGGGDGASGGGGGGSFFNPPVPAWDWRMRPQVDDVMRKSGATEVQFTMQRDAWVGMEPERVFFVDGKEARWAKLENSYDGNVFRSTQLVHEAFGAASYGTVNDKIVAALARRGVSTRPGWMTSGCVMRFLFQPRPLLVAQLAPFLNAYRQAKLVVAVHVRLGFLVAGAGADGRVRLSRRVARLMQEQGGQRLRDDPWHDIDQWIRKAAKKHPHGRSRLMQAPLADAFRCAEHLIEQAIQAGRAPAGNRPAIFLATDSKPIEQLAHAVYQNNPKFQLLTTPYDAKHSGNAQSKFDRLKLTMDWELLAQADELVSVGSIQSTFSSSAWHMSLRPDQLKHINDSGECVRGGGSIFRLKDDFRSDDPVLQSVLRKDPVVLKKIHRELR